MRKQVLEFVVYYVILIFLIVYNEIVYMVEQCVICDLYFLEERLYQLREKMGFVVISDMILLVSVKELMVQ